MKKIYVYTEKRGIKRLKEGILLEQYKVKYPDAIQVRKPPCIATLEEWSSDCGCEAIDGCWVEPDGHCEHGKPSWLLALNYI